MELPAIRAAKPARVLAAIDNPFGGARPRTEHTPAASSRTRQQHKAAGETDHTRRSQTHGLGGQTLACRDEKNAQRRDATQTKTNPTRITR